MVKIVYENFRDVECEYVKYVTQVGNNFLLRIILYNYPVTIFKINTQIFTIICYIIDYNIMNTIGHKNFGSYIVVFCIVRNGTVV